MHSDREPRPVDDRHDRDRQRLWRDACYATEPCPFGEEPSEAETWSCGAGTPRSGDPQEIRGAVVRFFSPAAVERLAEGWETVAVRGFGEGALPRRPGEP